LTLLFIWFQILRLYPFATKIFLELSLNMRTQNALIERYFKSFQARNLADIEAMFSEDVTLQDPIVGLVKGKSAVLLEYKKIFDAHPKIEMELKRIYTRNEDSCAVEFELFLQTVDGKRVQVDGVDCIEFKAERINSVRAYLDIRG